MLVLIVLIQAGAFALIATVGASSVRRTVSAEVTTGARAFERLLDLDTQRMAEGMRVLAAEAAFREGITANDRNALTPMLAKQGKRIGCPADDAGRARPQGDRGDARAGSRSPDPVPEAPRPCRRGATGVRYRAGRRPALPARGRSGDGAAAGRMGRRRLQGQRRARAGAAYPHRPRSFVPRAVRTKATWKLAASTLAEPETLGARERRRRQPIREHQRRGQRGVRR